MKLKLIETTTYHKSFIFRLSFPLFSLIFTHNLSKLYVIIQIFYEILPNLSIFTISYIPKYL